VLIVGLSIGDYCRQLLVLLLMFVVTNDTTV